MNNYLHYLIKYTRALFLLSNCEKISFFLSSLLFIERKIGKIRNLHFIIQKFSISLHWKIEKNTFSISIYRFKWGIEKLIRVENCLDITLRLFYSHISSQWIKSYLRFSKNNQERHFIVFLAT